MFNRFGQCTVLAGAGSRAGILGSSKGNCYPSAGENWRRAWTANFSVCVHGLFSMLVRVGMYFLLILHHFGITYSSANLALIVHGFGDGL